MNRKLIRALYKNQLSICNKFGYKYGDWIDVYSYENFKYIMSHKKRRKFVNKMNEEKYIKYVANYIRYEYKNNIDVDDFEEENDLIDYSFFILKNMKKILRKKILH